MSNYNTEFQANNADLQVILNKINNLPSAGSDVSVVTATAGDVLSGKVIVGPDGNPITGTIPSVNGATITPGVSSQIAVPAGRYTTGAVTVAAIPNTYSKIVTGTTRNSNGGTYGRVTSETITNLPFRTVTGVFMTRTTNYSLNDDEGWIGILYYNTAQNLNYVAHRIGYVMNLSTGVIDFTYDNSNGTLTLTRNDVNVGGSCYFSTDTYYYTIYGS